MPHSSPDNDDTPTIPPRTGRPPFPVGNNPTNDTADVSLDDDDDDDDQDDANEDMAPLPHIWLATAVPTPAGFRCGEGTTPTLAAMKGQWLTTIALDDSHTPALAKAGVVKTTRQGHKRILRALAEIPQHLQNAPLVTAVLEHINDSRRTKRWQWSTTMTRMAATQGALRLLPLYTKDKATVDLRDDPTWLQAMRTARRMAQNEVGYQPKAITMADLRRAVELEPNRDLQGALIIAWMTARARGHVLVGRAHPSCHVG